MGIRTVAREFRVNSYPIEVHLHPAIATMPDGRLLVTWSSGDAPILIRARFIEADGDPIGNDIAIRNMASVTRPDLTLLPDGNVIFATTDTLPTLVAVRSNGTVYGSGLAATGQTGVASGIAITTLVDGSFVTAWESQGREDVHDGAGSAIVGRVYRLSTAPVATEFVLNGIGVGDQLNPALAALSDGGFVATWGTYTNGTPGLVGMRLFAGDGTARTGDLTVASVGTPSQADAAGFEDLPGFVVAWRAVRDGVASIYARVYDGDGIARNPAFLVSDIRSRADTSPTITMLDDGRFVVLWNDGDVKARLFDTTGAPLGAEFRVSSDDAAPDATALAGGRFAATWTESDAVVRAIILDARSYEGTGRADSWKGGNAKDTISGLGGADRLYGLGGNDRIEGGSGADRLSGGDGADVLVGGSGADILTGKADADRFVYRSVAEANRDRITDFVSREDRIDLSGIDARDDRDGNQAFTYIRGREFSGRSGELRFEDGVLAGDTDGDRVADFRMTLTGVDALRLGDLILRRAGGIGDLEPVDALPLL